MQFYKRTWFIVLMLIFLAPLGIFLMWRYKPTWGNTLKIVLTVCFCIWFWILLISAFAGDSVESVDAEPLTTSVIQTQTVHQTQPEITTEQDTTQASTGETTERAASSPTTKRQTASTTRARETTTQNPDAQITVYITKSGSKYHNENPCGNGTYYPISLADAKAQGYEPCEKCVLH